MKDELGFNYIIENLKVESPLGKNWIKNIEFLKTKSTLEKEYDNLEQLNKILNENNRLGNNLKRKLQNTKDISIIIERIKNNYILDDIELFEIKRFVMNSQEIYELLIEYDKKIAPQNMKGIIKILDPEGYNIESFYIYSSYSEELKKVREELRITKDEKLIEVEARLEDEIREKLTKKILNYYLIIESSIKRLGYLDFNLAKIEQINTFGLTRPRFGKDFKILKMFNPEIKNKLDLENKKYQKIDVNLDEKVGIITGANMSGKTLTLKTLGLIQKMAQSGFYVPCDMAEIEIVNEVLTSIGDLQSMEEGLSSFAGEILKIDEIIKKAKLGYKALILIDELGRTTNPQEGRAILKSIVTILRRYNIKALITTHYDVILDEVKRYKVMGVKKDSLKESEEYKNIQELIDYSLIEIGTDKVPEEALLIAKILKIDNEIIEEAYKYL